MSNNELVQNTVERVSDAEKCKKFAELIHSVADKWKNGTRNPETLAA